MDKDLNTIYATVSAGFGMLFGVELGVMFFALAGSFVSMRFVETKTTSSQAWHVVLSTFIACMVVGGTSGIYPDWISLRLVGLLYGFAVLLVAEKIYVGLQEIDFAKKLNAIIDKVLSKWTS